MAIFENFADVPLFRYDLIMADPPWLFENWSKAGEGKNATAHYDCTPLDWIKGLRVADLASPNCLLWLWARNPMLPQAIEVMAAWGFTFKTAGHWSKKTVNNKQAFGTGYILRSAGEPFLIGTIGKPRCTRGVRSVIEGTVRAHSQKPEEAFAAAEALLPGARRIELFSRHERAAWDVMGDQVKMEAW